MAELRVPRSPGAFKISSFGTSSSRSSYLNMLIYGDYGVGKTTLLGSAVDTPSLRDVLIVTAEGGTVVFRDNDRVKHSELLDIVEVSRIEQLQKIYEFLLEHCRLRSLPDKAEGDAKLLKLQEFVGLPSDRVRRYMCVGIDSLTEIEAQNMAKILKLDEVGIDVGDELEVAGYPQFRKNLHIIQRMVRQFRDLPLHVIMLCAQGYTQDELKRYHYSPKLTGRLSGDIQGFFDVVGWLVAGAASENGPAPRRLFVQPQSSPKADAKCRLAAFTSSYIDNPTMGDIVKAMGF